MIPPCNKRVQYNNDPDLYHVLLPNLYTPTYFIIYFEYDKTNEKKIMFLHLFWFAMATPIEDILFIKQTPEISTAKSGTKICHICCFVSVSNVFIQ